MSKDLKIAVNDDPGRAAILEEGLRQGGHDNIVHVPTTSDLLARLPDLARRTIGLGLPAGTPLVAVVNATCADEQVVVTTMGDVARSALMNLPDEPTLILYGEALRDVEGQVRTAMRQVA